MSLLTPECVGVYSFQVIMKTVTHTPIYVFPLDLTLFLIIKTESFKKKSHQTLKLAFIHYNKHNIFKSSFKSALIVFPAAPTPALKLSRTMGFMFVISRFYGWTGILKRVPTPFHLLPPISRISSPDLRLFLFGGN